VPTTNVLSLLPPLLALVLAVATRNVLVSLGLGVLLGFVVAAGMDPLAGAANMLVGVPTQLAEASHLQVAIIILVIGGFVRLLERSGGMASFAARVGRVVHTPARAQLSAWLTGLAIFFTDSGNALILGPMFRPVFDRVRVSREKLAFIVDSTSAPVCVLIPFISWGVYIMSLLEEGFEPLGIEQAPLGALMAALPFQIYPLLALATVPLMAVIGREFGPMARAQARGLAQAQAHPPSRAAQHEGPSPGAAVVLAPLGTVLVVLAVMFAVFLARLGTLPGAQVRWSLLAAYGAGTLVAAGLLARAGLLGLRRSGATFLGGTVPMLRIVAILVLAWSLGDVCETIGTGRTMAALFEHSLPSGLLPATLFLAGGAFALSTGSSWGTFALLLPVAIPVAFEAGVPMPIAVAAVLSGGIFGDHCSPVSDTTVLSSMACGCEHAAHVNTQLPYALLTGASATAGFLIAGFTSSYGALAVAASLQVALVVGVMRAWGREADQSMPSRSARNS
jgi:Na+/H+ antiporter NhaC